MSNFQSITFVAGEVPSVSKWNILNTNDQSLSNGTAITALTIGSVTNVTIPYKFSVYKSATNQTITSSPAIMVYDAKEYDTGSNFSTSTNLFTAPIAGFYHFDATCQVSNNGSANSAYIDIYKNGFLVKESGVYLIGYNCAANISSPLQLAAGDTIGIYLYDATGTFTCVAGEYLTYFSGFLISNA